MDSKYRPNLRLPPGIGQPKPEKSIWDKIADQFRAQAAPLPGDGPKIDQDKARDFVKGFKGQ